MITFPLTALLLRHLPENSTNELPNVGYARRTHLYIANTILLGQNTTQGYEATVPT
jgi:hypothetical protein